MKQLLLLLLTFFVATTFGQKSKPGNKISIGYSFSPDYSFRTLKNGDGKSSTDLVIKSRDDIEKAKFGYTTGFNVTFHFSDLLGFETGVQYLNKGYKTKEQDLTYFPPNPSLPNKATTSYSYQYIGIPIKAKFSFGKNKVRFISSAGFMTNFLINVKQSTNYKYSDGKKEKKDQSSNSGFNKIDISPMASIGVDYKLTDKIHLSADPTFRFGLIKTKDTPVKEKLWNVGLVFGISYDLK
ncbi:MAG: PorT family protein [Bacteroidetes bacterium]|nr:PorT family protein [Bacteroidota bacterium]